MTQQEVLEILRQDKLFLQNEYGVTMIGLFGSYAKHEQKIDSDIDFFVEISEPLAKNYFGLWNYLEKRFNKKVDLARKGSHLREKFIRTVEKEIIYA